MDMAYDEHGYYKWHVFVIQFLCPSQSIWFVYLLWTHSQGSQEVF